MGGGGSISFIRIILDFSDNPSHPLGGVFWRNWPRGWGRFVSKNSGAILVKGAFYLRVTFFGKKKKKFYTPKPPVLGRGGTLNFDCFFIDPEVPIFYPLYF